MTPVFLAAMTLGMNLAATPEAVKELKKSVVVNAPVGEVYAAWTTKEGLESFFCREAIVEMRYGGRYEAHFSKNAPVGLRGAEGTQVLSFIPNRMLSFSWNAPPVFPIARIGPKTFVVVEFADTGVNRTRVDLTQGGWPSDKVYEEVYTYFDKAWDWVLEQCRLRFEAGPRDLGPEPPLSGKMPLSPGYATLKQIERFIGGTWRGVLSGPERIELEFKYTRHPDGTGIMSQGVIGANMERKIYLNVMFGIDPNNGELYYLDAHDSGTVYFGWVVLEPVPKGTPSGMSSDLVFSFGPVGGDLARFSSRGRFVDDDTYQSIIRDKDGRDVVGLTLKRAG